MNNNPAKNQSKISPHNKVAPPPPPPPKKVAPPPPPPPPPNKSVEAPKPAPPIIVKKEEKFAFTISELAQMFKLSNQGVRKKLKGVEPDIRKGNAWCWYIHRVAILSADAELAIQRRYDVSKRKDASLKDIQTADRPLPVTDLGRMTPQQLKVYFQTVDVQQTYLKKRRENQVASKELIPKESVRENLSEVFKIIGNFMDSLPDVLERDGLIEGTDVDHAIELVDRVRHEMSTKVSEYADSMDDSIKMG